MERVISASWVLGARWRVCSDQASGPVPSPPVRICFTTGQRSSRFFSMNAPDSNETYIVREPLLSGWVATGFAASSAEHTCQRKRAASRPPFIKELLRSGQCEVHRDGRINFYRLSVQHVGLVLPLLHRIDSG